MKALDLYKIKTWEYPEPDNGTVVYYETWVNEVWIQWTVWIQIINKLDKLDKVPKDPLYWNEYTYSVLNTKKEYQVAAALEWWTLAYNSNSNLSIVPKANATSANLWWIAYVKWTYNWQIAKIQSWSITYVLAVPTIINWDMSLTDIIEVLNNKKLGYYQPLNNSKIL
jgi:hypothetical protein